MSKHYKFNYQGKILNAKQLAEELKIPYPGFGKMVREKNCQTIEDVFRELKNKEKFHIGDKYGKYTIISDQCEIHNTHIMVKVRCECGKETKKLLSDLKTGQIQGCANCMARERSKKINIGETYKQWKVLEGPISTPHQWIVYKCICTKCNASTRWITPNELLDLNKSHMCQKCAQKERGQKDRINNGGTEYLSINKYNKWKRSAKTRNYEFSVSIQYLTNLYLSQNKQCAITGDFLPDLEKASLDRIDSSKGYIEGNVQWVTIQANLSKHVMTMEELYNFCKKVLNHANQQPSQGLTTLEGSETNGWNYKTEYNTDTSAEHPEMDDDIVRHSNEN